MMPLRLGQRRRQRLASRLLSQLQDRHQFPESLWARPQERVAVVGNLRRPARDHRGMGHRPRLDRQDRQVVLQQQRATARGLPWMHCDRPFPVGDLHPVPEDAQRHRTLDVRRRHRVVRPVKRHQQGLVHPGEAPTAREEPAEEASAWDAMLATLPRTGRSLVLADESSPCGRRRRTWR